MGYTGDSQPPDAEDRSAGDLVKVLSQQVSVLARDELKLAQLEMTRKGKQAGLGIGTGILRLEGDEPPPERPRNHGRRLFPVASAGFGRPLQGAEE